MDPPSTNEVNYLKEQLKIARTELNNLRQKVHNLQRGHKKDVELIHDEIKNWQCSRCQSATLAETPEPKPNSLAESSEASFKPIGVIRTKFPNKRGTPRQPSVTSNSKGKLHLYRDVLTNPEHALAGLNEFSHMWILFHFHKHMPHAHAKVMPPRLNGARVGVFGTRSPHRPNPIGLSLVQIVAIDVSTIEFLGVDMVDGTPVYDIKPYIPSYDQPRPFLVDDEAANSSAVSRLSDCEGDYTSSLHCMRLSPTSPAFNAPGEREAPDGEEQEIGAVGLPVSKPSLNLCYSVGNTTSKPSDNDKVRVPNWVNQKKTLSVALTERAQTQLNELNVDRRPISDVLQADPRSIYLRQRYGGKGQSYTFQMENLHVTCIFQDDINTCLVINVQKAENMSGMQDIDVIKI